MSQYLTRIAVICDCPLLQRGLSQVIEAAPDLEKVNSIRRTDGLRYEVGNADVVVLSLRISLQERCDLVTRLHRQGNAVVVLSSCAAQTDLISAIESGVRGYLSLQTEESELLTAFRTVASGRSYFSTNTDRQSPHTIKITERERQVLELVASGATDRQIASKLNISEHTVHSHLDRLRRKTGSRRRADLTRLALRQDMADDFSKKG
ncbi:response regulator transcription factor [Streptomyces sp. NBC_00820]|uniref:response regulator transcription factor n=1 Tax=Streptomyces sp. NBC_00820 TaxID=2975842 RepID=UPI002ED459E0|nr:response regulator transcription factor [Streptomyces sp. NBC_00820]